MFLPRKSQRFYSAHCLGDLLSVASKCMEETRSNAIDRRPIATRNRKWAQDATAWLASQNVSPNAISIAGMFACIVAGIALALTSVSNYRILWLIAAIGAQLRLTANMLDGMVAIASSRTSKTGELYNEVPVRISDAAVFSEPASHGAEMLRLVTSQPFWPSSPLTFARQEKLPEHLTSSADQWQSNIACSSLHLSVFTRQSRRDHGRLLPLSI